MTGFGTALLLFLLLSLACKSVAETISFQAHSYNDLREWPQLLLKSTDMIKVDINYAPSSRLCRTEDPRGCLVLNHDNLDPTLIERHHNDVNDLVSLLYLPLLGEKLRVLSLCFKNVPGTCGDTEASRRWLSLADELIENIDNVRNALRLDLRVVVDGEGSLGRPCMKDKWPSVVSTYVQDRDAPEAFTNNSVAMGYNRLIVLDDDLNKFPYAAKRKFGKFPAKSSFPIIVWEPDDEPNIRASIILYQSSGVKHAPGLRLAANMDPGMFETYAASATKRAWHDKLVPGASKPSLVALPSPKNDRESLYLLLLFDISNQWYYVIQRAHSRLSGTPLKLSARRLLPLHSEFERSRPLSASVSGSSHVLVSDARGQTVLYELSDSQLSLKVLIQRSSALQHSEASSSSLRSTALISAEDQSFLQVSSTSSCPISLGIRRATYSSSSSDICLLQQNETSGSVTSLHVSYVASNAVVLATIAGYTFAATVSVSHARSLSLQRGPTMIGVGSEARSSLLELDGDIHVVFSAMNSFCYNSHGRNIHAGSTSVCDQLASPQPYVLSYTYGTLNALNSHIEREDIITPCSGLGLLHGSYDIGAQPSVAAFVTAQDSGSRLGFVEVHDGKEQGADWYTSAIECGAPDAFDGLVVDGWRIDPSYCPSLQVLNADAIKSVVIIFSAMALLSVVAWIAGHLSFSKKEQEKVIIDAGVKKEELANLIPDQ